MTIAFCNGGVRVVDSSGLVGVASTSTKWTPAAAGESVSVGMWLNAAQALDASREISAGGAKLGSICILRG